MAPRKRRSPSPASAPLDETVDCAFRKRAVDKFKVQSTPTFFINGTQYPGALSIDEMAKLIDPYLKG